MSSAASPPHACPWPDCGKKVAYHLWGCGPHWFRLPQWLRDRIMVAWSNGRGAGTERHTQALQEAQSWIRNNAG